MREVYTNPSRGSVVTVCRCLQAPSLPGRYDVAELEKDGSQVGWEGAALPLPSVQAEDPPPAVHLDL